MECNVLKIKEIRFRAWLLGLILLSILAPAIWLAVYKLEGVKPVIRLESDSASIGKTHELHVMAADSKTGLRKVWVGLLKDGKEFTLLEESFSGGGFFKAEKVTEKNFRLPFEPGKLGISDGTAILRLAAWDYSWRGKLKGNPVYAEHEVSIDTRPPVISLLSRVHNLTQGGAGLVVYQVSEPCQSNGVFAGENFFPGQSGFFKDPDVFLTFIALSHTQGPGTEIYIEATDAAGNQTRRGIPNHIRGRVFKKDVINLSESFLNWKIPEFNLGESASQQTSLIDKFLIINRDLRKDSYRLVTDQLKRPERRLLWQGSFLRLPKSARKAGFADHRAYRYNGRVIDRQVHQGVDLASLTRSPVPAANGGKVCYAGDVGIYGHTIIIDHGFGLFSMYSHLSTIGVGAGDMVEKGQIIGRTGVSGLAGGDHLHFSMLVHQVFVNPIEWWDPSWIENNINGKIRAIQSALGEG